jgi:hypothetical protein
MSPAIRAHVMPGCFKLVQTKTADVASASRADPESRPFVIQAKHEIIREALLDAWEKPFASRAPRSSNDCIVLRRSWPSPRDPARVRFGLLQNLVDIMCQSSNQRARRTLAPAAGQSRGASEGQGFPLASSKADGMPSKDPKTKTAPRAEERFSERIGSNRGYQFTSPLSLPR